MSGLEVLLAIAGLIVTALVVVGMVLITPRGVVEVRAEGSPPDGSNLSPVPAPEGPGGVPLAKAGTAAG
jgi:hypothetical protein